MDSNASIGINLALTCARAAHDMKAEDIKVLDLREVSNLADYIVICSGNSMPHLKAILRDIDKDVSSIAKTSPFRTDGKSHSRWVVLDYIDVIVHIMLEETRSLYALEDLWGDAKEIEWNDGSSDESPAS